MISMLNDADYYRRRREEEDRLAAVALDPGIRVIHQDLARRYASLHEQALLRHRMRVI